MDKVSKIYEEALKDMKFMTKVATRRDIPFIDESERWKLTEEDYEYLSLPLIFFQITMKPQKNYTSGGSRIDEQIIEMEFILSFESKDRYETEAEIDRMGFTLGNWYETNFNFFTRKEHTNKKIRDVEAGPIIEEIHKNKTYYRRQLIFKYYVKA